MADWTSVSVEMLNELANARHEFGPMRSAHEGWAILFEEVDELWREVCSNKRDMVAYKAAMRKEAIQVAAMALAFVIEVCDSDEAPSNRFSEVLKVAQNSRWDYLNGEV